MAKRGATMELNHDNWDDEYEEEKAGTFKPASDDIIMKRKIKTAKRRSNTSIGSVSVIVIYCIVFVRYCKVLVSEISFKQTYLKF